MKVTLFITLLCALFFASFALVYRVAAGSADSLRENAVLCSTLSDLEEGESAASSGDAIWLASLDQCFRITYVARVRVQSCSLLTCRIRVWGRDGDKSLVAYTRVKNLTH